MKTFFKSVAKTVYCHVNISRQTPGKRDVKSVRNKVPGKKEKVPVHHKWNPHNQFIHLLDQVEIFLTGSVIYQAKVKDFVQCVGIPKKGAKVTSGPSL
ncbi:hypothetical protein J6590_101343 [Homalodisca vitripennis]|nr:hypothetical protein J6590_018259 [Homalodisca vitripennis]KAG8328800.1 hypothetical protein J6590_101343 [Homalodisca vitripennis]